MKICIIGNEYVQQFPLLDYGGIESSVENLCLGMQKFLPSTDKFCVIVPKRLRSKKEYDFSVIETDFIESSVSNVHPLFFLKSALDIIVSSNQKPDIIWAQSAWSAQGLYNIDIPTIVTIQDSGPWENNKFVYKKNIYYRFVSKFIYDLVFKDADKDEYINKVKSQSFWLHTSLDDNEYEFEPVKDDYILWVAGLNWGMKNKGLDTFIELSKLMPNQKFVAYGTGDNDITNYLNNLNTELHNFTFKGKLERGLAHRNAFKKAKLFMMLTRTPEAFGRTNIEALSKGTPVIGSMSGAVPEIVNYPGIGFCSNNIDEIIHAINNTRFDYSACFNYAKEKFYVKHEIDGLLSFTKKILG